jgi:hypothetical protein
MAEPQGSNGFPSTYVTTARIQEIRRKMLHGAVNGTPEQREVAAEIWHADLPDLLETLDHELRGVSKEKPHALGCMVGVVLAVIGGLLGLLLVFGAYSEANSELEKVKEEAAQRCAELGATYADGGAKVGGRTVYCIPRPGVPTPPALTPSP